MALRFARRRLVALALSLFVACSSLGPAPRAQVTGGQPVSEIRVEGSQRIEPDTVRSYMTFHRGDRVTEADLDKSLKSLYATGLFADVTLRREGTAVVVRVVENPIINRIAFEGNRRISDQVLRDEIRLRPRIVYTRSRVQADVQRIIELYRRGGRFAARVVPKVIQLPQNRVNLVFEIEEGKLTEIRSITFLGNKVFSDSELRSVIQTKESAWYRFLSGGDSYDPDRLTFDRELLRRHYLAAGYADFRVVSVVAELTPDRDAFFITFTLEEGERYKFGKVQISTALRDLDPKKLRAELTVKEGAWYDADAVQATIGKLSDAAGRAGYAFVEVRPRVRRDRAKRLIDITFDVQEGPRVFVERIDIRGNVRTEDKVIRREFELVEGDAFNTEKLRRTQKNLRNLGFFEKVDIKNVPGSTPDRTVIQVDVKEKSTGEVSFGAGYSSSAGIIGDVTLRERNLLGRGQDLRLGMQLGQRLQQIDLSFTEPYFLDRKLAAGIDVFDTQTDLQVQSSYNRKSLGFRLRTGYFINENLSERWNYTLRRDNVTNVGTNASIAIKDQEGISSVSAIGHGLTYDTRDNRFAPHKGVQISLDQQFAGLGGSQKFLKNELRNAFYFPVTSSITANLSASAGYIFGLGGSDIRIIDRFVLGGASLRGFADAGVGPRDLTPGSSHDAVGGKWYYNGSVGATFPLGLPDEFGINGRAFVDFGSLGGTDGKFPNVSDTGSLRASIGGGLGWRSPFGPISIDLATPLRKESFDKTEIVRFSFGTRF